MGWIKLHRKLLDSAVYDNPALLKVWVWCLFKASYKAHEQVVGNQVVKLEAGQFVYGRIKCSDELGISESMLYRHMKLLEKLGNLNIIPNNKYSVITVVNWSLYQGLDDDDEHQSEQQMNSKRTADEQQMNTNKKDKKGEKEKKEDFGEFGNLKMTAGQMANLRKRFPDLIEAETEKADGYIQSHSYQRKYTDWYAFLRNWCAREEEKRKPKEDTYYDKL